MHWCNRIQYVTENELFSTSDSLAQLAVHYASNAKVPGSNPMGGDLFTDYHLCLVVVLKFISCKNILFRISMQYSNQRL